MLRHNPLGLGHPYRHEPDQRIPLHPIAGAPWKVRACTDDAVEAVFLHLLGDSETTVSPLMRIGLARSEDHGPYGKTAKMKLTDTHLAEAAARSGEYPDEIAWEISLPILDAYQEITYWLENDRGEQTRQCTFSSLVWSVDDSGFLKQIGEFSAGVSLGETTVLKDRTNQVYRIQSSLPLRACDHVVGFGERFHSVDQRGELVDAIVYEEYKGQGHRTYLPTPFGMIIGSDYGFHIESSTPSRFDIGVANHNRLLFEVDIVPGQGECQIRAFSGSPSSILSQYMSEFDLPKNPPSWIYGLWGSSNEWNTQARVEKEIDKSIACEIDLGVIVIEAWSDESTFTVFRDAQYRPNNGSTGLTAKEITYPADGAWPNPQKMINDLHARDMKILLWQIPVIKEKGEPGSYVSAIWEYAINNDLVVKDGNGDPYLTRGFWFRHALMPDLTDSKVRKWWADLHSYLVTEMGVDGFKTDGGEHAWGIDLQYLNGRSGMEMNNLFPVGYAQTFHELMSDAKKDGVTFSRSGFAGSSAYPTFWAGDEDSTWEAFQASIRAGITASASGIFFWGWDIGGFSGALPTTELYLRGTAMATFCPIMQFHSEFNHHHVPSNDRSPWNLATRNSDPEILTIFREFVEIRKSLIPYLCVEGELAIASGRPLMAGLFFDYSHDPEIWDVPYQYMLGRYLLVAPITEPGITTAKVYLPEGNWRDFWSSRNFAGKQWVEVDVPINRIAVFVHHDAPDSISGLR
ncbi:MAG TPA: TIM-barrel domain-containing protein [Candidatus Nanopelagicaceae bacterium]